MTCSTADPPDATPETGATTAVITGTCTGAAVPEEPAVTEGLSPPLSGAATLAAIGLGTLSETPRPTIPACELDVRSNIDGESAMAVVTDGRTPAGVVFRGAGRNAPGGVALVFFSVGPAER
jgi:hypothetical protein